MRNNFQDVFERLAQEVLPPDVYLLKLNGINLHPRFKTVDEGGGWDNETTCFGLTVPTSHGKSLIVQINEDTEAAIRENAPNARLLLRTDLQSALDMWGSHAVPHEIAKDKMVKL
jgi:hypothetical protein